MNAVVEIEIRAIGRPDYDDTNLGNQSLWIFDNSAALARRWQQLGRALGIDDKEGEEDLDCWLKSQHDLRMLERAA